MAPIREYDEGNEFAIKASTIAAGAHERVEYHGRRQLHYAEELAQAVEKIGTAKGADRLDLDAKIRESLRKIDSHGYSVEGFAADERRYSTQGEDVFYLSQGELDRWKLGTKPAAAEEVVAPEHVGRRRNQ